MFIHSLIKINKNFYFKKTKTILKKPKKKIYNKHKFFHINLKLIKILLKIYLKPPP